MAFNEKLLPQHRIAKPFGPIGCTVAEYRFLSYFARKKNQDKALEVETHELSINGETGRVTTVAKHWGDDTYLVTESSIPDWEGLILQNRVSYTDNNVIRYFHGEVAFKPVADYSIDADLLALGFDQVNQPHAVMNLLVEILASTSVPVGESFRRNCVEFSRWIKNNHQPFYGIPWPTQLDKAHNTSYIAQYFARHG